MANSDLLPPPVPVEQAAQAQTTDNLPPPIPASSGDTLPPPVLASSVDLSSPALPPPVPVAAAGGRGVSPVVSQPPAPPKPTVWQRVKAWMDGAPQTSQQAKTDFWGNAQQQNPLTNLAVGFSKSANEAAVGVKNLANDVIALDPGLPQIPALPAESTDLTHHGIAQGAGMGVEQAAEFLVGEEALKGLSVADRMKTLAPVAKLIEKYPTLARLTGAAAKGATLGGTLGGVHGAATGEGERGAIGGAVGGAVLDPLGEYLFHVRSETKPIPKDSGLGSTLKEPAPSVRVTDTSAGAQRIEQSQTVAEPHTPVKVFHGSSAEDVTDITKLDSEYSRTGIAGSGLYVTENPAQASQYVANSQGGRVVSGILKPNVSLLDGDAPLPKRILDPLRDKFPDIKPSSTSYMAALNDLNEGASGAQDIKQFQKIVSGGGYDGVRYTGNYPSGPRSAILLFGKDVSGKTATDLFTPTVPTARVVADDYIPTISHDDINSQVVQKLIDSSGELAKAGIDPSKIQTPADAHAMLFDAAKRIGLNLDPRALATISFSQQKQLAQELGMGVSELLERHSGQAFNAEQVIAARALLRDSGQNVVSLAQDAAADPANMADFLTAMAQHQAIFDQVSGFTAEAGRALGSFRLREAELPQLKLANALSKLPDDAKQKAAELLAKIDPNDVKAVNSFVKEITPASTADKIFEYYRNALLSSPHVPIVKGVSEAGMMALESLKKLVAAGVSKLGPESGERYAAESYYYAKGAMQALRNIPKVLTGEFDIAGAPGFEESSGRAIKGTLGKIVRAPQSVLSKQTNMMYMLNYYGELNAQAARQAIKEGLEGDAFHARQSYLAANPTEAMEKAAHDLATENTFQSKLGGALGSISHSIQVSPKGIARYVFPFFKTPINLVKESAGYSPYGLVKGLAQGDVDSISKGLVGSSIAAGIAKLALDGTVTGGGPVDLKKRETLEASGWQPYSIKIGGKYYSYHRMEPLGLTLGLVADTVHGAFTHEDPEVTQSKADNAVAHIARNVDDLPLMMTLSNLAELEQGDPSTKVQRFVANEISGFIPAFVGDVARAGDRTYRKPDTIAHALESRIPGMTQFAPAEFDITGQPSQRPFSQLGGANPFPISSAGNDPVLRELGRLGIAQPQPPASIKTGKDNSVTINLTPDQQAALMKQEGQLFRDRVAKLMAANGYPRRNDDQRRKRINEIHEEILRDRKDRVLQMVERDLPPPIPVYAQLPTPIPVQ